MNDVGQSCSHFLLIPESAPCIPFPITLPSSANVLHTFVHRITGEPGEPGDQLLFATTADRCLHIITLGREISVFQSSSRVQDSPILSCLALTSRNLTTISSAMSGQLMIYDHKRESVIEQRRDHNKYVVKLDVCQENDVTWVATAGWDSQVLLYRMIDHTKGVGPPVSTVTMQTNPETLAFVKHPDSAAHILLVARRDSTSLYFYRLPELSNQDHADPSTLRLLGSQNLAPHSNAWIAFSPSAIALHPTDSSLLAVATSAVPHMKLIIVRLLIPSLETGEMQSQEPTTHAAQTRAVLARQDLEDKAIQVHVSTLAPQTPYSTPQVVWRPDGSGVWVNGDDGVLRGIEAKTGKIVQYLKRGHEAGSKVRSVWCGFISMDGVEEEVVISGGFDHRLIMWRSMKGNGPTEEHAALPSQDGRDMC